jgi:hypothetical protein
MHAEVEFHIISQSMSECTRYFEYERDFFINTLDPFLSLKITDLSHKYVGELSMRKYAKATIHGVLF